MATRERRSRVSGDLIVELAAGEQKEIPRHGRNYLCVNVTTDSIVKIGINQEPVELLVRGVGDGVAFDEEDFTALTFLNTGLTAQTITLKTSFGTIVDNRLNLVSGILPTDEAGPNLYTDVVDASLADAASLTYAADTTRRGVVVYWPATAPGNARWGVAPDATHGMVITPGSKELIPGTGAFKIYNASGAAVTPVIHVLNRT